ncbi:MAG: nucleotide sugar dehydrogenase [Burkholderiaceae bacterium]|jgi:UDP-N-acetyl-D-galactosamine dehydrogenase|nr:nucleotide sugar dehydrogenase [Burkholderiaceae bacterium]
MIMRKISNIVVLGLGYVGCPLALALSRHFNITGLDIDKTRISELLSGCDRTNELSKDDLLSAKWLLTSEVDLAISAADVIIVTVPTPITNANVPDLDPIIGASKMIAEHIKAGTTVVYESTVYPGVTEDICVPILEQGSKLKHGEDFWVAYSPERINPGDKVHTISSTTKIVSGDTPETLDLIDGIYAKVTATYRARGIKIAEAAKVIENTQRDVNIGLMNELSQIFSRLGIDTLDAIDAAASKWNFIRYVPGFVGGHCISVDPYYLTHRSAQVGYIPSLILAAREVNDKMPQLLAEKTLKAMRHSGLLGNLRIAVLGITFKENVPDIRNSKAVLLVRELQSWEIDVQVIDPIADPEEVEKEYGIRLTPFDARQPADAVVLAVAHHQFVAGGWDAMLQYLYPKRAVVITDVKGVLDRNSQPENVTLVRV